MWLGLECFKLAQREAVGSLIENGGSGTICTQNICNPMRMPLALRIRHVVRLGTSENKLHFSMSPVLPLLSS